MTKSNEFIIKSLKKSPLFALSLGGKEISHSNFWAWLIEQEKDGKKPFIKVFMPDFYKNKYVFKSVNREKNNTDVSIEYEDENRDKYIFIIENKIKAIPNIQQLKKYQEKCTNKKQKFGGGLLTGVISTLDLSDSKEWSFISYEEISRRIDKINREDKDMAYSDIIEQYSKDILNISKLMKAKLEDTKGEYIFQDDYLEEVRFADIFAKLKGSELVDRINERLSKEGKRFKKYNKWRNPIADLSFNNKKPTITIVYQEIEESGDEETEIGRLGVQIEGNQFRIYGGGTKQDLQENKKSMKIIEDTMFKSKYLDDNFKENIEKRNLQSPMRNEFCSYGQKNNSVYYHLYQYWKITDTKYDLIIDNIFDQLDIAKELIESGFTFSF